MTDDPARPGSSTVQEELEADRLFSHLLDRPRAERQALLERACADRPRLRALVESLLASSSGTWDVVLDAGEHQRDVWLREAEETLQEEQPRSHLGPYRLVRELGRGGMGVVHLAERADGHFDQRVALKLLHLGASAGRLARFRQERQILASLEHPGIARLLDGGVTTDGLPFLVMEYVDGQPIDRFAEERQLGLPERLRLFLDVCRAVSAAHRQLVVHRDLKPSNILVSADGTVKLLDFGIAKLLSAGDGEMSVEWTRAMTPSYASPEQFLGRQITVASDVYQLGLLLYRLLVGRLPYDVRTGSVADAERLICRQPPPKASSMLRDTRLTDTGGSGSELPDSRPQKSRSPETDPHDSASADFDSFPRVDRAAWSRALRGDLDNIAAKALAKAPSERYVSVDALIDDVERYLAGQPVAARQPTFDYVVAKFLGRHRRAVAAGVFVFVLVAALTLHSAVKVRAERLRVEAALATAETAREEAEVLSRALVELFSLADPERGPSEPVDALELLERSTERVRQSLADQPLARARILHALGEIYTKLDRTEQAADLLHEALAVRRAHLDDDHAAVIESSGQLGVILGQLGRFEEAEALLRRVLDAERTKHSEAAPGDGEALAVALNNLGNLEWRRGRLEHAETYHRRALGLRRAAPARNPVRIGDSANNLGVLLNTQGRGREALPYLRLAAEAHAEAFGPEHPTAAVALNNLSGVAQSLGRYREAEQTARRVLAIWRRAYGPDHLRTLRAEYNVGLALLEQGETAEGVERLRAVAARHEETGGVDLARAYSALARGLLDLGDLEGAAEKLERCLEIRRSHYGEDHSATLQTRARIAQLRRVEGETGAAILELRQVEAALEARENTGTLEAWVQHELGLALEAAGDVRAAEATLERAIRLRADLLAAEHPELAESRRALARVRERRPTGTD